ncbi:flxA-like family protein, partial [Klebsiella pneumoniae]|nr:flxA-like family protein [Klebsiella pneumoniae]
QLAQLQRQQAEEAMPKQENGQAVAEGINKPSAEHQINIYI